MQANSHLDLAYEYWQKILRKDDWAIDATCGNGRDTARLAPLCQGLIALDIQEKAIENTRLLLEGKAHLFRQSHETFPPLAYEKPIRLIVYNLGYLPGGDKDLTTRVESTLKSLQNALK
ncbi:MAG: hypothetical protein K1000chlam2_01464, partial [Chlamydiae bacterium]|nr:hypothetical protein [Chlamydiota bacterium]